MTSENKIKILYIEDEEGLAFLLTRRLARHGFEVDTSVDGNSGLKMLDEDKYDIVLVDYKLPRQSGLDVITTLAQYSDAPPTIMLTGAGNERIAVEAIQQGASDYIVKDSGRLYLEVLPTKINKAVEQHLLKLETKRAQIALRESEERLRSTVESLDDVVLLINTDFTFIDYYRPVHNATQMIPMDTFVGKQIHEVLPPSITELFYNAINKVSNDGEVEHFDYQLTIDNSTYWFSVKISQRRDVYGHYDGVTVVVRDITKRKSTEQTLRQSEERFRQLFEYAPSGMLILTSDGRIRHVNQAFRKMLDFDAEYLLDLPLNILVHPNEKDSIRFGEARSNLISTDVRFLRSDRQIIHATLQATHLKFSGSLNDYVLVQVSDKSDRKAAEARLISYINLVEIIQEIDQELHRTLQLSEILDIAVHTLHTIGSPDCTYIALTSPDDDGLHMTATVNVKDNMLNQRLPGNSVGYGIIQTHAPEWIEDIEQSPYVSILPTTTTTVGIPMIVHGRLLGVVILEASRLSRLGIDIYEHLTILSNRVAIALNSAQLVLEMQSRQDV